MNSLYCVRLLTNTFGLSDWQPRRDVRRMQQALVNAGRSIPVDGTFGAVTERAVRDFQEANGLAADGIVVPSTRRELGLAA